MDEYFQISDKTRTLEHQYATLLSEKQRLETLLVEEDFFELYSRCEELERNMSEIDVNKYEREIRELRAQINILNERSTMSDNLAEKLTREKEELAVQLQREASKKDVAGDKKAIKELSKEIKDLGRVLTGGAEGDVYALLQGIKRELEALGAMSLSAENKAENELMMYKTRETESACKVKELTREVDRLKKENGKLVLRESEAIGAMRNELKELMEKQAVLLDAKPKGVEGAVVKREMVLDASGVEELLDPEIDVGRPWDFTAPGPMKKRPAAAEPRRMQRKSLMPTGTESLKPSVGPRKALKKSIKSAEPPPPGPAEEPENIKNTKDSEAVPKPATVNKSYVPASLLRPENSSFFADLSFNNSSPIVKNPKLNPPKKNLQK
jgi:hypothetical protein